jgi:hypothetical protein
MFLVLLVLFIGAAEAVVSPAQIRQLRQQCRSECKSAPVCVNQCWKAYFEKNRLASPSQTRQTQQKQKKKAPAAMRVIPHQSVRHGARHAQRSLSVSASVLSATWSALLLIAMLVAFY